MANARKPAALADGGPSTFDHAVSALAEVLAAQRYPGSMSDRINLANYLAGGLAAAALLKD